MGKRDWALSLGCLAAVVSPLCFPSRCKPVGLSTNDNIVSYLPVRTCFGPLVTGGNGSISHPNVDSPQP